jgi:type I restriction enzyme S subunit
MMTKKWQPYPTYKDSGVEWLGKIPEHWEVKRLKFNAPYSNTRFSNKPDNLTYIGLENIESGTGRLLINEPIENVDSTVSYFNKGDILFGKLRPYLAKVIIAPFNGVSTSELICFQPTDSYNNLYFFYLLLSSNFIHSVNALTYGTKMPRVNPDQIANFLLSVPPLHEQQKIAEFLDQETSKIDKLITKKERLIELLKEKRTALISHAVTKGLNPDVPMKDSGVEWLGEVPEGWEVKRFRELYEIRKRIAGKLGYNILAITQQGIQIKDIDSGEGQLSMDYSKYQLVHQGEFAMNQMDLLTGFVDISKYEGVTSPDYRVFTLEDKDSVPEYHLFYLQMGYLNRLFYPFGHGAAHLGRWRLPTKAFREFVAPCPPKEEQEEIANYIFRSLERNNLIHNKVMSAIQLLKEYRTALISAAVTGKIDVREH